MPLKNITSFLTSCFVCNFFSLMRKKYKLEFVFVYKISLYFVIVTQWSGEETWNLWLNLMFQFLGWDVITPSFYYKYVSGTGCSCGVWGGSFWSDLFFLLDLSKCQKIQSHIPHVGSQSFQDFLGTPEMSFNVLSFSCQENLQLSFPPCSVIWQISQAILIMAFPGQCLGGGLHTPGRGRQNKCCR